MSGVRFTQEQVDEYNAKRGISTPEQTITTPGRKASEPNKTELRFESEMIIPWLSCYKFEGYKFRGLALIWPDMRYTPDWMLWDWKEKITLIEVKGPHIHSRDSRVRFLTARRDYPWFNFEGWQYAGRQWRKIWK
ncbi:hypothetical protein KKE60_06625 [Patescibacteria group bacterium]|nr:hypothetical protein [Patescibacteria group bacterium]